MFIKKINLNSVILQLLLNPKILLLIIYTLIFFIKSLLGVLASDYIY